MPEPSTLMTDDLFTKCFQDILNNLEIAKLSNELRKKHGKFLDVAKLVDFIEKQVEQSESKTHRKARSVIKRILAFFADYNVTVKDWFRYFSYNNLISKPDFFTLMQTFPFKLEMDEIDDLFSYIDESRL
jgi:Ca2+-binding EF-hand superfamily protein